MVHGNHLQLENLDSDSSESSVSEKLNDKSPSLSVSTLSSPELSTHRCNFQGVIKPEELRIPRTVPCIVISPNNEMNKQPVYSSSSIFQMVSPLDSIMTKISKLSNPSSFRGCGNNNGLWEQSERYHENNLRESVELYDSMKQLVRNSQIRIDGSPTSGESTVDRKSPKYGIKEDLKETISNKLSFGIDRILANEKSDPEKSDESKPFLPLLTKTHQDFHPRYVNQCSECYLFSRFCYKYTTLPPRSSPGSGLCQSSPNCSSWNTTPHFYEPNSQILLPSNGYGHSSLAAYSQNNSTSYNGISSIVSCNTNGNGRRKRSWSRAVFSNLQRKGLEKRFQIQKYITKPDRRQLASTLGLTDAQVKVWFQNRRMKWRHTKEGKSGDIVVGTTLNPTTSAATPTTASSQDKK